MAVRDCLSRGILTDSSRLRIWGGQQGLVGSFWGGGSGGSYVYSELERDVSGTCSRALGGNSRRTYVEDGVPTDAAAAGGEFEAIAAVLIDSCDVEWVLVLSSVSPRHARPPAWR